MRECEIETARKGVGVGVFASVCVCEIELVTFVTLQHTAAHCNIFVLCCSVLQDICVCVCVIEFVTFVEFGW